MIEYEKMYESKVNIVSSVLDGQELWRELRNQELRYSLARISAGTIKYYNQGVRVMTTYDFLTEMRDGKIKMEVPFKPLGDSVVILSVNSAVDLSYPHIVKRGRTVGFVFSCGEWKVTSKMGANAEIGPSDIGAMVVHSAMFSMSTGSITVSARFPAGSLRKENSAVDFTELRLRGWLDHSRSEFNRGRLLETLGNEKVRDLYVSYTKRWLDHLGDDVAKKVIELYQSAGGDWADPRHRVYAENAWIMVEDHPECAGREEEFMERWRMEGEAAQQLEKLPLRERLKLLTESQIHSFCFWPSDESMGFMLDWRLALTEDEVNALVNRTEPIDKLKQAAVTRWCSASGQ